MRGRFAGLPSSSLPSLSAPVVSGVSGDRPEGGGKHQPTNKKPQLTLSLEPGPIHIERHRSDQLVILSDTIAKGVRHEPTPADRVLRTVTLLLLERDLWILLEFLLRQNPSTTVLLLKRDLCLDLLLGRDLRSNLLLLERNLCLDLPLRRDLRTNPRVKIRHQGRRPRLDNLARNLWNHVTRRPSTRALTCQQLLATTFLTRRLQRQLHLSSLQVHDLRRTHDPRSLQRHWRPPRYHAPVGVQEWRGLPHHTPRLPQVPCEPRVLTTQSPLIRLSRQETQSTQTAL